MAATLSSGIVSAEASAGVRCCYGSPFSSTRASVSLNSPAFPSIRGLESFRGYGSSLSRGLRSSRWTSCRSAPIGASVVVNLGGFPEQETPKFREELIKLLESEDSNLEVNSKIADVCAGIFKEYAASYSGVFSTEPFAKMRDALASEGIPQPEKAVLAAVGWTRSNLYSDWKRFSAK